MKPSRSAYGLAASERDFRLAASLLAATGFAALGHQLLWTRRMSDLIGASTASSVWVFVCFFLGLAFGAAASTVALPRITKPWRSLAAIELTVALLSLPVLSLPWWTGWLWPAIGPETLTSRTGPLLKTLFSLLVLVPPTFGMGLTLPIMVAAVCVSPASRSRQSIWLYAVNTFGGVLSLAWVTAFSLPLLGIPGSMLLMTTVNLAVAAVCYHRSRRPRLAVVATAPTQTDEALETQPGRLAWAMILALLSGAGVMALEVLSLQLVNLSVPLSIYPPAIVLFVVILLLAVSSGYTATILRRGGGGILPLGLALAACWTTLVPVIFLNLAGAKTAEIAYADSVAGFLTKIAGVSLVTIGPAFLFAGLAFPIAISWTSGLGQKGARNLGLLLAVNGMGGVMGAEAARSILVPWLGVHTSMGFVGIAYGLAAAVAWRLLPSRNRMLGLTVLAGVVVPMLLTRLWLPSLPLFYWGDAYHVMEVRSGREGVLTVFEREGFGRGLSFNNQYLLGGSGGASDEQRQAHLPLLLHPAPTRVAFAGLGTGITASGALDHQAVRSVTAVELSPMVVDAAARHFAEFNGNLVERTNVNVVVEDALTYLAACSDRFDVIIGDLFTPWRPGEAGLASIEYFRATQRALRSGGVFCQWFPLHQLTGDQLETVLATFLAVYPRAHLFLNHFKTGNIPLALIGGKDFNLDWRVVERRCSEELQAGRLLDPLCRHAEGVAMFYFGTSAAPASTARLNTLGNLRLELSAGRELVLPRPGQYFSYSDDGNPWMDFVKARRKALLSDAWLPDLYRRFPEVGLTLARLDVAYDLNHPAKTNLEQQLRTQFPAAVLGDAGADWSRWAGSQPVLRAIRPSP